MVAYASKVFSTELSFILWTNCLKFHAIMLTIIALGNYSQLLFIGFNTPPLEDPHAEGAEV